MPIIYGMKYSIKLSSVSVMLRKTLQSKLNFFWKKANKHHIQTLICNTVCYQASSEINKNTKHIKDWFFIKLLSN